MSELEQYWRKTAARLARRINFGWWLQAVLFPSVAILFACSVAILLLRNAGRNPLPAVYTAAGGLALTGIVAWFLARRRFHTPADALARLDFHGRLNNRLTAAASEVGEWPPETSISELPVTWRWRRLVAPPLVTAACLTGAWFAPIPQAASAAGGGVEQPAAWTQVQQWIDQLEQEKMIEPRSLDRIREELDALRKQAKDDWYKHASLEAGDHLKEETAKAIENLEHQLSVAEKTLGEAMQTAPIPPPDGQTNGLPLSASNALSAAGTKMPAGSSTNAKTELGSEAMKALQAQWNEAMQGLSAEGIKLDPATMAQLSKMDLSKIRKLSPEEMKRLREQLAKCKGTCSSCSGKKPGSGVSVIPVSVAGGGSSPGSSGAGMPGSGGVSRGRGDAPLTFGNKEAHPGTTRTENTPDADLSKATLGDALSVVNGRHETDPAAFHAQEGGNARAGGSGEAVWKTEALPEEQPTLERYFNK